MAISPRIVELAEQISKLPTEDEHLHAVQAQIVVASDLYRGMVQVCSDRNGLAGEALLRSLFEGITSAIILAKHCPWLKDFVRHGRFTELRMMRVIQVDSLKERLAPQIAATESEFQKLLAEFGDKRWHKMGTTASFTEAEFQPGMYDRYYRRASVIAHGQPYVTVRDGKIEARRAVWERLSIGALIMADLLMLCLLTVVNREFKLALGDKLIGLQKDVDAAASEDMNKIRKAAGIPGEELRL